ncbi:MAG TPA: DNA topoisomerase I [Verrucomicrobiae bacterium]|nr:DNA topoisomerase I [Verrucomicrobiae bacterium]
MVLSIILKKPYDLVICEKPSAAQRIAQALGTFDLKKTTLPIVDTKNNLSTSSSFFSATDNKGRHFIVCSALGHLFGLIDKNENRHAYPVFDISWVPLLKKNKKDRSSISLSEKIEQHIKTISMLSIGASNFIHACDYDQEGEVIGYNILQYACNGKYSISSRAKFSTLTDDEIKSSFDNLLKPRKSLAEAGLSRHMIDFFYGVNLSRALTESLKLNNKGNNYYNLSIGRVQGPTLSFIVDREFEIQKHVSIPYWNISAKFVKDKTVFKTLYQPSKINSLSKATFIVDACKNQDGKVANLNSKRSSVSAPHPFNLGDLQKEAYRLFRFSPSYTLKIAEKLYLSALISYPRTSGQNLPESINYKKIILGLSKIDSFTFDNNKNEHISYLDYSKKLLSNKILLPNNGTQIDIAHPAIYPTGEKPKSKLSNVEFKLLDLIIRRFFATFGEKAIFENTSIIVLIKDKYKFISEGKNLVKEGWLYYYKNYVDNSIIGTPNNFQLLQKGDILKNIAILLINKFTPPPSRFNQSSLLEKMEKEKIGTKSTRSEIINTLFKRNYISNISTTPYVTGKDENIVAKSGISPTDLGVEIIKTMRKYVPDIVSIDLTRSVEEQLENIETNKIDYKSVTYYAENKLKEAIFYFKENQKEIGQKMTNAVLETKNKRQVILGPCPVCTKGNLIVKRSNKTKKRFVGCSLYSTENCTATASLPQKGGIIPAKKLCSDCKWPMISSLPSCHEKDRPYMCLNTKCHLKNIA